MKISEIINKVENDTSYEFLRTNPHLGNNIIMLGLGGSYAYGTNTENSDIDIRGVAVNSKKEILLGYDYEQVTNEVTDTTVYSVKKMFKLLANCNPNVIEILGLEPWQTVRTSKIWQKILNRKEIFLSKICVHSFGGYANAQLRRLENKAARLEGQAQREKHILDSIRFAETEFRNRYPESDARIYIDKSDKPDMESELFIDANLKHYPFRDFHAMCNEYHGVIRAYDKIGKRNQRAIEHDKLGKHMMHLIRLYLMAFDILERHKIKTYRDEEHDFLMDVRNGKYLDSNRQPIPKFYEIVDYLDSKLKEDAASTDLPDSPNWDAIEDLEMEINMEIIKNGGIE